MGPLFTWWDCNIQNPKSRKLDRVLINSTCHSSFPLSLASFLPRGISDHNPAAGTLGFDNINCRKPFQFFSHLIEHQDFFPLVMEVWSAPVEGDAWYILTLRLKKLKFALRNLNKDSGNLHSLVVDSRVKLTDFQAALPPLPSAAQFTEERRLIDDHTSALHKEESFLKQKSRVFWLKQGDGDNKFFFNA